MDHEKSEDWPVENAEIENDLETRKVNKRTQKSKLSTLENGVGTGSSLLVDRLPHGIEYKSFSPKTSSFSSPADWGGAPPLLPCSVLRNTKQSCPDQRMNRLRQCCSVATKPTPFSYSAIAIFWLVLYTALQHFFKMISLLRLCVRTSTGLLCHVCHVSYHRVAGVW